MKNTLLAMLINLMLPRLSVVGEGGGAPADAGGDAGGQDTTGGEKELSLRDSLSAEIEIQEKGPESNELSEAAKRLAAARKPAKMQDKADDKVAGDAKAKREAELAAMSPEERAKAQAEDGKKVAEATEVSKLEAPAHWPAADRELFAKQTPEAQKWLLGRHKAMEADYTRRVQEVATFRREADELGEIFAPWKQQMDLQGITRVQAIRQLAAAHKRMQEDPAVGIQWLAQNYGIDLKSLVEGAAAADPAGESPTVKALRQQVETLSGQLKTLTGAQNDQQMNAHLSQVEQFAEAKDDQGKPKHPHFDEVAQDVARLIRAARAGGETLSLQDAYDRAIYANPTTRAKVLAAQDAERRAKEESDRKAKADAAKRAAAANITGEGSASAVVTRNDGSVRSDLEAAFASVGDRV